MIPVEIGGDFIRGNVRAAIAFITFKKRPRGEGRKGRKEGKEGKEGKGVNMGSKRMIDKAIHVTNSTKYELNVM